MRVDILANHTMLDPPLEQHRHTLTPEGHALPADYQRPRKYGEQYKYTDR